MILLLFSFSLLLSDTIIVDINGQGDYLTIQEGINASENGDTVLVYPGTYYENIDYNGKDITVASKYLTTGDNSYIDSTIIDGNQSGSVVKFNSGEDSTAVLSGFTITSGTGTIDIFNWYCGGGIFCKDSTPKIKHCHIMENSAFVGGGIYCKIANVKIDSTVIRSNTGGGIYCWQSNISLSNNTICYNHFQYGGGGICFASQSAGDFSVENRCNIFLNYAGLSNDIHVLDSQPFEVFLDTATVTSNLKDFIYFYNVSQPTIDILHSKIEPVNQDLFVSPDGDDTNSGLNPDEPMKTISWALINIASDSIHLNTIHLTDGIYSPETTGERFPLNMRKYVSIIGESEENTILDGNELSGLITCIFDDSDLEIKEITIQNGGGQYGGGIYIGSDSNPMFRNVTIKNNISDEGAGGGIYCMDNSNPIFENVKISNNSADIVAGVKLVESNTIFINCIISNNTTNPPYNTTAGISCSNECSLVLINTMLIKNSGPERAGIYLRNNSYSTTVNNSFGDNNGNNTTIYLEENGNIELINSILWDNTENEIVFYENYEPNYAEISYTDIKGGESGIQTNGNGTYYWGPGNINENPMFVDTLNNNYQLRNNSPCIDAGTPDTTGLNLPGTDLAGNPRIYNGRIDIGAYEYQGNAVEEPDTSFINKLYLFQNKPNPFTSSTTITFISADYERIKDYKLSIYNARGQLIKTYNGKKYNFWVRKDIVWDGTDEDGNKVSPGVYFYKLEYGNNAVSRKMLLVK